MWYGAQAARLVPSQAALLAGPSRLHKRTDPSNVFDTNCWRSGPQNIRLREEAQGEGDRTPKTQLEEARNSPRVRGRKLEVQASLGGSRVDPHPQAMASNLVAMA